MNRFEKILLTVFFIELFVGGGGRLIDFGFLSIRQVIFLLILITFFVRIIKERAFLNPQINTFFQFNLLTIGMYCLIVWFFVSAIIGFVYGHPLSAIVTDILRVSFVGLYFPLAYYISDNRFSPKRIITILKYSALTVAVFTITVSLLGKTFFSGADFRDFYYFMNWIMNDDLYFRPSNSVFYKSHLYVLIGLILSLNAILTKKYSKIDVANIILCSISVLWSETRGFLLAFVLSVLVIIIIDIKLNVDPVKGLKRKLQKLWQSKQFMKKAIILLLVIVSVPFMYQNMTLSRFETNDITYFPEQSNLEDLETEVNDVSVNTRIEFILDSKNILLSKPLNFIIGTGYGTEIAGRMAIEMSFLDILVEQGVIGFGIWVFLFLLVIYYYYRASKRGAELSSLDISLVAAFIGMLLLTNINPFVNNPIGITFLLIMLIFAYSKNKKMEEPINTNGR